VPQRTLPCQLPSPRTGDSRLISPETDDTQCPQPTHDTHNPTPDFEHAYDYSEPRFALVRGACQEVSHTKSRRSGPRKWVQAVQWLIGAGLHPKANATTQRVADDLAQRMDYDTGHVLYGMDAMGARLDLDPSNVRRHVRYLRELGALAWVQRGSRANILRRKGEKGYAGTATVYAAAIPAVFDHAMGHRIIGTGYTARIVVDLAKRPKLVDNPETGAVDNSADGSCALPSLTVVKEESQVQMVGGFTTTAKRTRNDSTPTQAQNSSRVPRKRSTILGAVVTATGMQLGDKLARAIRRRVPWTRKATHDQLRWACADMGEQRWSEDQAVRFVVEAGHAHRAGFAWNPDRPHRLIAAELYADHKRQQDTAEMRQALAQAVSWQDSTAGREQAAARAALEALFGTSGPEQKQAYTAEDRERARLYGWDRWEEVAAHYADDPDDAIDLYDVPLCQFAVAKAARLEERQGAWA
jgi:hypothetical protein